MKYFFTEGCRALESPGQHMVDSSSINSFKIDYKKMEKQDGTGGGYDFLNRLVLSLE